MKINHEKQIVKKISVLFVMWVYAVSTFLQSFSFLNFNKVYAQESQLDYTNLVAIFVDKKIYWSLESNIEWYAKTYIQWANSNYRHNAISNSRSIVLPVDIDNITAPEITKILENMYFDWISWEPSKLVWVILIWDIPLPVVNQDGLYTQQFILMWTLKTKIYLEYDINTLYTTINQSDSRNSRFNKLWYHWWIWVYFNKLNYAQNFRFCWKHLVWRLNSKQKYFFQMACEHI